MLLVGGNELLKVRPGRVGGLCGRKRKEGKQQKKMSKRSGRKGGRKEGGGKEGGDFTTALHTFIKLFYLLQNALRVPKAVPLEEVGHQEVGHFLRKLELVVRRLFRRAF